MNWLRSNIKHGTRAALFALALQFALSFAHCHAGAAQVVPAIQSGPALSELSYANGFGAPDATGESAQQQQPASDPDSDRQKSDACPICVLIVLANAVLLATPPLLLLPQAVEFSYLAADAGSLDPAFAGVAFQPRAPPVA
jgi:hypothetical protein